MTAEQYNKLAAYFRADKRLMNILVYGNKIETYLFYAVYPLLLVILAATSNAFLLKAFVVPAVCFIAVSVVRRLLNMPRPYEVLAIEPLIAKDTKGKSCPSRHVFSVYMIAMTWLYWCPVVGIILLLLGLDMIFLRVAGGVHFPKDVLIGALVGVLCGIVGFWLIP